MYKLALVGECYGEEDVQYQKSFLGKSGAQLNELLGDAGLNRADCYLTSVFKERPRGDDPENFFCKRTEGDVDLSRRAVRKGLYLRSEYAWHLDALRDELTQLRPNLVVVLGSISAWAIMGSASISKIRGTCTTSDFLPAQKLLATFSPREVLRQYDARYVTILDLQKAQRESATPDLVRPVREIWMDPGLEDMERFLEEHLAPSPLIGFDIETAFKQITCIGFASSAARAIVVPFLDYRKPGGHYWSTLDEELRAWDWVRRALATAGAKVGQNTLYDIQYLWRLYGMAPTNYRHDTMLLHHSLLPESQKSLGFLGSVYTNEIAWKPNRPRGKHQEKPEDQE